MRLFVTEFITGGGIANDPLPETLKQEGQLMLQAVLSDCSKIEDIELITTRDARISLNIEGVEMHVVENAIDYMQQLVLISTQCDMTWVIAPESEGILYSLISHLANEKVKLINCDAESVQLAGDKLACNQQLTKYQVPVIPNLTRQQVTTCLTPVMIKDRYGAGCEGLMRCETGSDALQYIEDYSEWVVQPYMKGEHLSLSVIFSMKGVSILSINEQILKYQQQKPKLVMCRVNTHPVNDEVIQLVKQIYAALPGLRGYVGIDVIYSNDKYFVVDINPRLTSSYVGLSDVLEQNPAELCLYSVLDENFTHKIYRKAKVVEVSVA